MTVQPIPFTAEEFDQWMCDNFEGWGDDLESDTDGGVSIEDAACDIAENVKYHQGWPRAYAYMRSAGCKDITGALADFLYEIAYKDRSKHNDNAPSS